MIWLRPELFKFTDPESVCQLSGTSKTLQIDLQGTKAWARLAEAQYPPPTPRDDNEARSHVQRRWLATVAPPYLRLVLEDVTLQQALSREKPAEVAFNLDEFSDFTYFLRLEDSGRLIWEGDLRGEFHVRYGHGVLHLPMSHVELDWTGPSEGVEMTLVAVRDHDQAMVPLGFFYINDDSVEYDYHDIGELDFIGWKLFTSARSRLELLASFVLTQDASVHRLELALQHTIPGPRLEEDDDDWYLFDESRFRHVLSYLAGIHPAARASAFATIESWIAEGEQGVGWDLVQE